MFHVKHLGNHFEEVRKTGQFYDGTKLLSMRDLDGNRPEIYLCTTNRSAGKTTFFSRYLVKRYLEAGEKFMLLFRYSYELDDIADKFFRDIQGLFFPEYVMTAKRMMKGVYQNLFLNGENCGYAVAVNSADPIKRCSHLFSDTQRMMMDEFQSESDHYCPKEVQKFLSLHTSIARGQGQQSRYLPVYMLGNKTSLLNPYYVEMGISSRLTKDTKFLRGHGYVLECGHVEAASEAREQSGVTKAFSGNRYLTAMNGNENVYLNDNTAFIEKPTGKSRYMLTFKCDGSYYSVREFAEEGVMYCDNKPDMSFPLKITVTLEDHTPNYVMLQKHTVTLETMRTLFRYGSFRFKNLQCKEACIKMLSL